jgi:tetratricopeptide (TPR) repeat protein
MLGLLWLTLYNPSFWNYAAESMHYLAISQFCEVNFVPNLGGEDSELKEIATNESFWDRLISSYYVLSIGWFLCLFASGALLFISARNKAPSLHKCVVIAMPATAAIMIFLTFGIYGQLSADQAATHLASGNARRALELFRRAALFDPQLSGSIKYHLAVGKASFSNGDRSQPESLFLHAMRKKEEGFPEEAIAEFSILYNSSSSPLRKIVQKVWAQTFVELGLEDYARGNPEEAVIKWRRGLQIDPELFHALFFLAKGYFDLKQYKRGLLLNQTLLSSSTNRILNTSLLANIGDNYWELGMFKEARNAYNDSFSEDPQGNLRSIKSLGGT